MAALVKLPRGQIKSVIASALMQYLKIKQTHNLEGTRRIYTSGDGCKKNENNWEASACTHRWPPMRQMNVLITGGFFGSQLH